MFKFWHLLFGMMFPKIVEEGGAGSEPEPQVGGAEPQQTEAIEQEGGVEPQQEPQAIDPKEYEALQNTVMELAREKQMNEAIASIKAVHSDFDEKKVHAHLVDLAKKDPERAKLYNNPIGWEAVWLNIRPKSVENDPFGGSRKVEGVDRRDEIYERVKKGEVLSIDDQSQVMRSLLV